MRFEIVIIEVAEVAETTILSGAPSGRQLYARLIEIMPTEPKEPEALFLNFDRIQIATASYLRESVLAFRTFVRGRKSNFYPAVANANSDVVDEFVELVHLRGDVLMACVVGDDGAVLRCRHIGKLDPMQQVTFDLVNREGETTASKLMEMGGSRVKVTAWNNRLASLSSLGLISEKSRGRTKTYRRIFPGGGNGG